MLRSWKDKCDLVEAVMITVVVGESECLMSGREYFWIVDSGLQPWDSVLSHASSSHAAAGLSVYLGLSQPSSVLIW